MSLRVSLADRDLASLAGVGLFVALLGGGYYYNITFVQLGLLDLGTRLVGLSSSAVSRWMTVLAVTTVVVALGVGWTMDRRGWSRRFLVKLRLVTLVVGLQLVLTAVAPWLRSPAAFGAWVVCTGLSLGVGIPATFGLAVDLVPIPDRGQVAGAATAIAFGLGAVYPLEWEVGSFSRIMVVAMVPALAGLVVLVVAEPWPVARWTDGHLSAGVGRFRRGRGQGLSVHTASFWALVALVFGVYFVDSLGFLRIVDTPALVGVAWQSPDRSVHVLIAVVHVLGAGAAAVLYRNFGREQLFLWAFGVFALTHLAYGVAVAVASPTSPGGSLVAPLFYSLAVSVYTTLTFALWPDVSTPDDVGLHTAIGVGLAGWTATFLSTALALRFDATGVSLATHLRWTNALALGLFLAVVVLLYARWATATPRDGGGPWT